MTNLAAYIPTLNQRHLNWLKRHKENNLLLISQEIAEELLPRLKRNMVALPAEVVARTIFWENWVQHVQVFYPDWKDSGLNFSSPIRHSWILPDEDISHLFAEKYLARAGCHFAFEMIWARYDMEAVRRNQPVIPDFEISSSEFDQELMKRAVEISERSPDWWRTIGALAVSLDGRVLVVACNTHLPNEYETYLFGDPSINRDAGEEGKYTSSHAEEAVITHCARYGLALEGSRLYVTTFPCEKCARQIVGAGIKKVFFKEGFSSLNAQDVLKVENIKIIQVKVPE